MLFRQLFDPESSTYTYLLGDEQSRQAVLIDPVREQLDRDVKLLHELGLTLDVVLETHIHADHVTAAGLLRERLKCRTGAGTLAAPCVDLHMKHGEVLKVGALEIRVLATPGHTDDSVSYLVGNRVFTGDALLIRGNGRTDFQNGNASDLYDSITRVLFSLPDDTEVYPAHDYKGMTSTTIGEEKRHNPRVAGKTREQFMEIMANLNLPPPKKIHEAVPANRACGLPSPPSAPHG
ncbi:MAG: MBL fold metallo-hydrolase [Myxococcota bacterium]